MSKSRRGEREKRVPLGCPLSRRMLQELPGRIEKDFDAINKARSTGDAHSLVAVRKRLEGKVRGIEKDPGNKGNDEILGVRAALGYCLSVMGRWSGNIADMEAGVGHLGFVTEALASSKSESNHESEVRASACLGNALTRLAYSTHDRGTLKKAIKHLKGSALWRKELKIEELTASVERDLGDTYIGQHHWDKGATIKGESIRVLEHAAIKFAKLYGRGEAAILDEWAASMSSLAVAKACIASELQDENPRVSKGFISEDSPKARAKKCDQLKVECEKLLWELWRVFLGRLESPLAMSHRWARTVSNIAFAAQYLFEHDRSNGQLAVLAEVSFRAVTTTDPTEKRLFHSPDGWIWADPALERCPKYSSEHHRYRYLVNIEGLARLYKWIGND